MSTTEQNQSNQVTKCENTKNEREFIIVATLFQLILLIVYAISSDYHNSTTVKDSEDHEYGTEPFYFYSMFQDVHAMMFVGFGFLMTFLRKYGFSALTFNFVLCAFGIQWGMYIFHMMPWIFGDNETGKLMITAYKLIDGDIATAVVLISFGALLGRTNPAQLLIICFFELIFWAFNFYICIEILGIIDVGGSIVVHCFGAYFGLAVSYMIKPAKNEKENKSLYHSDIFAMIGTLFLWLYWPSFNGYFANRDYYFMDRAYTNTVLGLCGSTVATFIVSKLTKKGKFDMVHIQNATLAGGVAIGAAADLYLHPSGAMAIGCFAGALSVCGYDYLTDWMKSKLNIYDTCGVHNLHGMPGILGGIVSAIALAVTGNKNNIYVDKNDQDYPFGEYTLTQQAGYQVIGILITLCIAIIGGLLTSFIVKFMTFPKNEFMDCDNFIVPSESNGKDFLRGTIRGKDNKIFKDIDFDGKTEVQMSQQIINNQTNTETETIKNV